MKVVQYLVLFLFITGVQNSNALTLLSVKTDNANVRTGPGLTFPVQCTYGQGFPLAVVEEKGEWIKIKDFEGDNGWIYKNLLSKKRYVIVKTGKNTKKKINIRALPTTQSAIKGKAYNGVVFELISQKNDWVKVRHVSGLEGWINKSLLWGIR